MSEITGNRLELYVRCECGNEVDVDRDFSFDPEDFITKVCDCGEEYCEFCEKNVKTCENEECSNTFCDMCGRDGQKFCMDCEV